MIAASLALLLLQSPPAPAPEATQLPPPTREAMITQAVGQLVAIQENGEWPYEGVYRVGGEIPIGYRIGGTSIVGTTLLHTAPKDDSALAAIDRGLASVLLLLDDPLMEPSVKDVYDVRVWGHAYALAFLCELRAAKRIAGHEAEVRGWIPKLVETLTTEEISGGGWNYASHREPATFVTAPVTQALLLARSQGEKVPDELFERARKVLLSGRHGDGAFAYSGEAEEPVGVGMSRNVFASLAGSSGRSAACEGTLFLLGGSSLDKVRQSALNFFEHWDDLEARRKKKGTHEGPYRIAPYYFFYAHAYTAQAIELLPAKARDELRKRMLETLLRTRDEDGTWDDRIFPRTRNYGTSMAVLALLMDKAPLPAAWPEAKKSAKEEEPGK
ncbi:MAG: prenyltransferase/squalene oxidase repeat-containing protein [Planctomycetota bacterium]